MSDCRIPIVCPACKGVLEKEEAWKCSSCRRAYGVQEGVSIFSREGTSPPYQDGPPLETAERDGWRPALFAYSRGRLLSGRRLDEDQRSADWRYLLPLRSRERALVIGCGWGTIPDSLAGLFGRVFMADSVWEHVSFSAVRARQENLDCFPLFLDRLEDLPFPDRSFDLVTVHRMEPALWTSAPFSENLRKLSALLKDGGVLYLNAGNRRAFQHVLKISRKEPVPARTFKGYHRLLRAAGFSRTAFYAPLPSHQGIPLFYIPLSDSGVMEFFLRKVFPLFEMVSPEVKKSYGLEYRAAKVCVRLGVLLRLAFLARHFVPGYSIIAVK